MDRPVQGDWQSGILFSALSQYYRWSRAVTAGDDTSNLPIIGFVAWPQRASVINHQYRPWLHSLRCRYVELLGAVASPASPSPLPIKGNTLISIFISDDELTNVASASKA